MGMILEQDLNISFDKMAIIAPDLERTALNVGAYKLKEAVKSSFVQKFPSASRPVRPQSIGQYKITKSEPLEDAVRQTTYKYNTVKVHILGKGEKGSPLFIARFYEDGTKERYAKTYKGKPLKKKRRLGALHGYKFFRPTVDEQLEDVTKLIGEVYEHKIEEVLKENG